MEGQILSKENLSDLDSLKSRIYYSRLVVGNIASLKDIIPKELEIIDSKLKEIEALTEKLIAKHK